MLRRHSPEQREHLKESALNNGDNKPTPGHWLLAKLGKKVLRPGGLALTQRLLRAATPSSTDRVVEFGPGVGTTAKILLAAQPRSYTGIDPHPEGSEAVHAIISGLDFAQLVTADAQNTGLDAGCADLVVGEAMLTMQGEKAKRAIIAEAFRLLAPGGRYAIHELGLRPDDVPDAVEEEIRRALSRTINVNARPLTAAQWKTLLEEEGFIIRYEDTNPMALLEPGRIIADEGLAGALRFFSNVARNPRARERLLAMRKVFRAHHEHLCAFAFVAVKPHEA